MADKTMPIFVPSKKPEKLVKWKVKEGAFVSQGQILFLYNDSSGKTNELQKYKSVRAGTISIIKVKEGDIVEPGATVAELEECRHPTVMKDMCAECGADLRSEEIIKRDVAVVPMVHSVPELKVSEELAQKLGREDAERLLKDRKLVLLVDLDQTLVHTTNDNVPPNLKGVLHFFLRGPGSPGRWCHTRLRPRTKEFLESASKNYELHVCTFGARQYAHAIADLLDPEKKFFSHRILSRDECFDARTKSANLKALFPLGDNMVCIIDDREDVWRHATNLIHVRPYSFFQSTGDINAPPGDEKSKLSSGKNGAPVTNEMPVLDADMEGKDIKVEKGNKIIQKGNGKVKPKVPLTKDKVKSHVIYKNKGDQVNNKIQTLLNDKTELPVKDINDLPVNDTIESQINDKNELQVTDKNESQVKDTNESQANDTNESQVNNPIDSQLNNKIECQANEKKESQVNEETDSQVNDKTGDPGKNKTEPEITKKDEQQTNDKETKIEKEIKKDNKTTDKSDGVEKMDEDEEEPRWMETSDGQIEQEDPDDYLIYLEDILKRIHKHFYDLYDKSEDKQLPDLKAVIPEVKSKVLAGTSLVFSGLVPTHQKLEVSRTYLVAKSLGAEVTQDFTAKTTHLVAVRAGTAKVNASKRIGEGKENKLHVVTPDWLWTCAERWERVDERLYPLQRGGQSSSRRPPAHCSSPPPAPPATVAALRKRTPSGRFMDTLNPLLSFSSDDIADMDREVEDIFNESDESSSEEDEKKDGSKKLGNEENATENRLLSVEETSQDRLQNIVEVEPSSDSDVDDEQRPRKRPRRSSPITDDEPPDDDDSSWNLMGAALEREFLAQD